MVSLDSALNCLIEILKHKVKQGSHVLSERNRGSDYYSSHGKGALCSVCSPPHDYLTLLQGPRDKGKHLYDKVI